MIDLWMVGIGTGMALSTACTIGERRATKKRQQQQFDNMCNDMVNQFCEKYDLNNGFDIGEDPQ